MKINRPFLSKDLFRISIAGAMVAVILAIAALPNSAMLAGVQTPVGGKTRWYKGNTHTHTLNSDGDSTPEEVTRWYRENRYNFLVLSDHNFLTGVEGLNAVHGAEEKFLLIKGEEVTDQFNRKPLHINGLDIERLVTPQGGASVSETLQRDVDAIRAARGVPHINHPNFIWAITPDDLRKVRNHKLFEIFNGHPTVNNLGGGEAPGLEEMWDLLLKDGQELYGIAVDDAHVFKRPWDAAAARPGQGWVMVRAERLAPREILSAMERGDFYASTGVELSDYQVAGKRITIQPKEIEHRRYRVLFLGESGRVLKDTSENPAVYEIQGSESYVRAKVIDSNGKFAWTQPVFVRKTAR